MAFSRDQVMACYRVAGSPHIYTDLDAALAAADELNATLGTDAAGYGRAIVMPGMAIAYPAAIPAAETAAVTLRRALMPLPLIAVGAVYDQPVAWSSPMPSASYRVEAVAGAGLVGRAALTVVPGSRTPAGLTVRVTASLLVAAGAYVDVTAYA
ncbi:hypothetical protein [Streptomyces sp. Z26]|uniref:hypothetical protein n=1 Tax=Streptomyces sp. Z26 TaxID=2500177 RepID=UPI000EF145A6|nr:hypothetical protein [Streptomyces sp. Z26]RLL68125.1 hypothetical protein D7M15_16190 [Streptomyces sp. Z26]